MRTRSVTIAGIITITRVDRWWCYCLGRRRRRLGICRDDDIGGGACRSSMTWIVGRSIPEWQCYIGGDWLYRTSRFVPFVIILIVVVVVVTHSSTMIFCRISRRDWNNVRHKEVCIAIFSFNGHSLWKGANDDVGVFRSNLAGERETTTLSLCYVGDFRWIRRRPVYLSS